MPQWQSRMGELSEFQKAITVGMNIKDASNRETGRQLEMDRNKATVLVRAFLKRYWKWIAKAALQRIILLFV